MKKFFPLILLLFTAVLSSKANNVQIGTPAINVGAGTITFTIQWDNSWLVTGAPSNWDGVWVFVKRQACSDKIWNHALVSTVTANHSVTGGVLQVDAVTDGMGVFVRRAAAGIGNISSSIVTLNLQTAPNLVDNFQVFGIETVYVPQGDFYIGDGTRGTSNYGFSDPPATSPKLITSAIQTAGIGAANQYQASNWGSTGALPAAFPLGWNGYYSMKYEISQEQYASFLSTLSLSQQMGRTISSPANPAGTNAIAPATNSRNGIKIQTPATPPANAAEYGCDLNNNGIFNEAADGQNIACNFLSWADLMSYLDWAALRPMTEFEYEKTCRGTFVASNNENAWGNNLLTQAESGALNNAGQASETSTASGNGLCAYGANTTAKGPLRCGFSATATTTRIQAGATYYGAMDMSGNVAEQCVGGYNFNYSAFTTVNGDGVLTGAGGANTAGWPVTGGGQGGGMSRGSDWFTTPVNYLNVSDRVYMTSNYNQTRDLRVGGRGVRNF